MSTRSMSISDLSAGVLGLLCGLLLAQPAHAAASFLPAYYAEALKVEGVPLELVAEKTEGGIDWAQYALPTSDIRVKVEHLPCDRNTCNALFEQSLKNNNAHLTELKGEFRAVSPVEFEAAWRENDNDLLVYVARTPRALFAWTRMQGVEQKLDDASFLAGLRRATNRQRFKDALHIDNIEMGSWAGQIHQYAQDLLTQGQESQAEVVLKQVVMWAPSNYEAQLDYAEHTRDAAAARASAQAVLDNTEDLALAARAAKLLGMAPPVLERVPLLKPGLTGLRLVLVPLAPCDPRLLEEAGRLYKASLNVPVSVGRLKEDWVWEAPDRIYRQRDIQAMLLRKAGRPMDFTGWTLERHAQALRAAVENEDALSRFRIGEFLDTLPGKPVQYDAERYVPRLIDRLVPYRGLDRRTLYVGVTEADIFSDENNFLFSLSMEKNGGRAAILSYARMQAQFLGEPHASRKRLTERLAKELVPASLKQLGIPRPSDPTDPYSYSSGVDRLEQKTMILSAPTRQALDTFRKP